MTAVSTNKSGLLLVERLIVLGLVAVVCPLQEVVAQPQLELNILSSRPDMVSDGNALVDVKAVPASRWTVRLNGADVTQAFKPTAESGSAVALLDTLRLGKNALELKDERKVLARLDLLNHPRSGPLFSGPQQRPSFANAR